MVGLNDVQLCTWEAVTAVAITILPNFAASPCPPLCSQPSWLSLLSLLFPLFLPLLWLLPSLAAAPARHCRCHSAIPAVDVVAAITRRRTCRHCRCHSAIAAVAAVAVAAIAYALVVLFAIAVAAVPAAAVTIA